MSQTPGDGGTWLPSARKKPYQIQRADQQQRRGPCTEEEGDAQVFAGAPVGPPANERHRQDRDGIHETQNVSRSAGDRRGHVRREEHDGRESEQLESALTDRARRPCRSHSDSYTLIQTPPGRDVRRLADARVYWPLMCGAIVQNVHVPVGPVELLRALIRFDTSNPPGSERECIEFVGTLLEQAGIEHRYVALETDRPNLVARVPGRGTAPPLLLYGHVDVVPADPHEWTHPPFEGELADGEVWGRGALDMKGGVAMLVATMLHLRSSETQPAGTSSSRSRATKRRAAAPA